jgi:hypothetical protein
MRAERERAVPKITVESLTEQAATVDTGRPEVAAFLSRWGERYSQRNLCLLWLQRPDARQLHTFNGWIMAGRRVRHGEKAVRLIAPHSKIDPERASDANPDGTVITSMCVICLFDVSQTDPIGATLP